MCEENQCNECPCNESPCEPTPCEQTQATPTITFDDFLKLDLRVATVIEAEDHPNADKLLRLTVDLGCEQRQVIAGIKGYYEPSELIGKQIVVVANLAPRKMRGLESQGMLLAASSENEQGRTMTLITTDKQIAPGATVS